ncbi:MAG TPA: hypothetical protein VFW34_01715 [Candidatus Rubrimentiphilum sp.]|nr:hypothetical protein [Candidatus Rubrimentiphilum sp.]
MTTLSIATQRNAAQAALAAEFGVGLLTLIFGQGTTQAFGGANTLPVCNNGVKISVVSQPSTVTTTIDVYYDPVCTKLLAEIVLVQTLTSPGNASLSGTATFMSQAGAVIAYNSLSGTTTKSGGTTSFSVTGTAAPSPTAPAVASFGLSCSATGNSNACGFGGITNVSVPACSPPSPTCGILQALQIGNTFTFNGTQSGSVNTGGAALKAYVSAPSSMTLSPSGATSWTITGGGNPVINDSGNFSVTVGQFNLATAISIALSDATADASSTANMAAGPFGNTSGGVKQISNGASASFIGLDGIGNGTVLFSDGHTEPVSFFIVQ